MASYTIHPRTGEILTPRRPAGDRAAIEISALSDTRKLKPSPRRSRRLTCGGTGGGWD